MGEGADVGRWMGAWVSHLECADHALTTVGARQQVRQANAGPARQQASQANAGPTRQQVRQANAGPARQQVCFPGQRKIRLRCTMKFTVVATPWAITKPTTWATVWLPQVAKAQGKRTANRPTCRAKVRP